MVSTPERSQNAFARIPAVAKFLFRFALVIVLSGFAAVSYLFVRSKDPLSVVREIKDWGDYHRFDALITKVATEHRLDPRLVKAMQHWNNQEDAVPFALAEYNAGHSRVDRWVRVASQKNPQLSAQIFEDSIDFPSTAHYVRTILARYDFYKQRGPMTSENDAVIAE